MNYIKFIILIRFSNLRMKLSFNNFCWILLICFFSVSLLSQKEIPIYLPNVSVFYPGFDNAVQLAVNKRKAKKLKLVCDSCDTVRQSMNQPNEWLLRSNKLGDTKISVIDKKGRIMSEKVFYILPIGKPLVYLDGVASNESIQVIPNEISLKLPSSIPISMGFVVTKWSIEINGQNMEGTSSKLSEKAKMLLQAQQKGFLKLSLEYMDATGKHTLKEIFELQLD